ncbi:MAG: CGNR zinc finger domain-containing protein [Acidobacteria bacterium]|nr:CGNR zinc finger domain-containing protein [Acidobacteriota bacterium]
MNLRERPIASITLIAGRLCLDFVNTVGGRQSISPPDPLAAMVYQVTDDKFADYLDLLAWSLLTGILTEPEAAQLAHLAEQHPVEAASVKERAIVLREVIYRLSLAIIHQTEPQPNDLECLNQEVARGYSHLKITHHPPHTFAWGWNGDVTALDQMLWRIADSAAELFTGGELTRIRQCGGEGCGWLFEDTSRNSRRQWCDMQTCGNLAKVRRFRSRKRTS